MDAKCSAAGVDSPVVTQLLASLDYDRVRKEAKASLDLVVGEASVTVELGKEFFLDARAAVRQCGSKEIAWAF